MPYPRSKGPNSDHPPRGRSRLDRERLKQHRKRLGLSQEALAEYCFDRRLCVSIASIKRAESGKAVLYRTACHLAEIDEVAVEELSAEAEEAAVVASDIEEMESARVLIQLHARLRVAAQGALRSNRVTSI
jgi:transcriptional regulator with XRE-family HTH domain